MGTKLLAFLCTVDNQGTYTSALCLYPKSKEPVCFRLVSPGWGLGLLMFCGPGLHSCLLTLVRCQNCAAVGSEHLETN